MQEHPTHHINASVVKAWFQYRCERKTRYEMWNPTELAKIDVTIVEKQRPWAYHGIQFEERVVAHLGKNAVRPTVAKKALWDVVAKAFLMGSKQERYAYQINLGTLADRSCIRLPAMVEIGETIADLLRRDVVDGRDVFTVIDVKATRRSTSFHKAQVAFYAMLLDGILKGLGRGGMVSELGEIWHIPDGGDMSGREPAIEAFALAPYTRMVSAFIEDDLRRILAPALRKGVNETFFHVYFKCEECPYLAKHCFEAISADRAPTERDVSAVAGMSHEAKRALKRFAITDVAVLASANLEGRAGLGWSMQRRASLYACRASSLARGEMVRTTELYSLLMPPRVDTAIYLSADFDPIGDRLATIACLIDRGGDAEPPATIRVITSGSRQDEAQALVDVFEAVLGELADIDRHNDSVGNGSPQAIHAHLFMYEATEAEAIQGAVKRHMSDPRVRSGLLNMIRLFPPEDVVPEPEFRGIHHLPATAVRMVIDQLIALPVTVSNDLAQVSQALGDAGRLDCAYRPGEQFRRPFSSLLSIDVIKKVEDKGGAGLIHLVEQDVRDRLAALRGVVSFLIEESAAQALGPDGPMLRLAKRPFRFWETFDPLQADDLDILQAFEIIESRAALLATMVDLARPEDRRVDSGRCLAGLTMVGRPGDRDARPKFLFDLPRGLGKAEYGTDTFGLVLTDGDRQVLLDYAAWRDVECNIVSEGGARRDQIEVTMPKASFRSSTFQAMYARSKDAPTWAIDRIHKDVNTVRIAAFLKHLADVAAA